MRTDRLLPAGRLAPRLLVALLLATQLVVGTRGDATPNGAAVPAPREVLGFEPGTDYTLADFRQLREYFRRLDAASDRVQLSVAGESTEGNEMLVAVISSEANLQRLEHYRRIARRLALVRGVNDAEARALAREGKAIVWIDNGLHSSEVASAQQAMVLAHRVATEDSPEMREIRDNVILVLLPCINPDGMNLFTDWYRRTVRTPHQDSPMPWLYQKYVGHDNNRDGYMQTQKETQVVNRLLFFDWLPQVMYNQHQGTYPPRIFVPPFPDPVNPNIDPQVMRGVDLVGGAMQDRFEREGKDGVISRYQFSVWYNGSVRTTTYFHNIIGILTETGHASATPHYYDPDDFPKTLSNGVPTLVPSVTYPNPWKGGTLRLRDAMDYMLTGSLAVLEVAAKYRERFLYGIYQVGARQIAKGRAEAPVAFVVPPDQHDATATAAFIATLMKGALEVHVARAPFAADGVTYPAGTHVVLLAQPFRPFAKDLLEPQVYPDMRTHAGGPPMPPYDVAGWTLSYQMGVRTVAVKKPFDTAALAPVESPPAPAGDLAAGERSKPWGYAIHPADTGAIVAANRLLATGAALERASAAFTTRGGGHVAAGSWIVRGGPGGRSADVPALVRELGLRAHALDAAPSVARVPARPRRIGLYKSWVANMDEGWTRWVLEQHGFPFVTLTDKDVRAGDLRSRLDVIILPDQSPTSIVGGHGPTARASRSGPAGPVPPEYQGGIGEDGVHGLRQFVEAGGTLVTLDEASDLAIERFGAPFDGIRDVTRGVTREVFYCPGSVLRIAADPAHPLTWGVQPDAAAYFQGSRAFEVRNPRVRSIAAYAPADRLLMSGWLLGGPVIAGHHAAIEVPYGQGRVVLFAFRPQFRAQPHGTFKLLFNALY